MNKKSSGKIEYLYLYRLIMIVFGVVVSLVGFSSNVFVVLSNNGMMPVITDEFFGETHIHKAFDNCDGVNVCYLSDVIRIGKSIMSVGDIVIFIGGFIVFWNCGKMIKIYISTRTNKKKKKGFDGGEK